MPPPDRSALLRELNQPWRKDAEAVPYATLEGGAVTIAGTVCTVLGESFSLAHLTLAAFCTRLATFGITATVVDQTPNAGAIWARVLLDDVATTTLMRWTNPNWRVPEACGAALDREAVTMDIGLAQLDLLTAGGVWADLWGTYTGLARRPGETDGPYTARQLATLLRPRENGYALANLLEAEFPPLKVHWVTDTVRACFQPSDGKPLRGRPLRGWYYNIATIEILTEGGIPSLAVLTTAEANVAAGVHVFLIGGMPLAPMPSPAGYDLTSSTYLIGEPLPMKINAPPPIGIGKIGRDPGTPAAQPVDTTVLNVSQLDQTRLETKP
jgi:hypothetical protein